MNPDESIRLWLLGAAEQWGIREAHDYQWDDASTRPYEPYLTYELKGTEPISNATIKNQTVSGGNATYKATSQHSTRVEINLYRDKAGLHHLAAKGTSGRGNPVYRKLLETGGNCALKGYTVENMTPKGVPEGDRHEHYHMQMICWFDEMISHSQEETDAAVDRIKLQIFSDGPTYNITEDGIAEALTLTAGSGDIVITGTATLTVA